MRRIFVLALLIFILAPAVKAQQSGWISHASVQPLIDGYTEDAWDMAVEYPIAKDFGGQLRGNDDLSGSWKALWDAQNIYFFISVEDDSLYNLGAGASKFWIHDCAELFFDVLNNKDNVNTDDNALDDNYQYRFIWDLDAEPIHENPPSDGLVNVSRSIVVDSKVKGYVIEIKIPWSTLAGIHPFGNPAQGKKLGMEFKLADLDRLAVPSNVWAPDAELVWANTLKKDLKITSNFGTIWLMNSALSDTVPPARIDELVLSALGASMARLEFISPPDSNTGNAYSYQIRYSNDSISDQNWEAAQPASLVPEPLPAGGLQEMFLKDLPEGNWSWVAVRSADCFGNESAISPSFRVRTFDPDSIAPAAVADLTADSVGSFSVFLSFSASGDDGLDGSATTYDLRYAEGNLTMGNWESAVHVTGLSTPAVAGTKEIIQVKGLKPGKSYSFGIIIFDERPNASPLSNSVSVNTPAYKHVRPYTMDQFIGTNAFIDVPQDKMKAVGFIREYHPWSFTEEVNDQFEYNKWNGFWDFDSYYKLLKEAKIDVCPALWGSPSWLKGNSLNKPVVGAESPLIPNSYREMGEFLFQYAARYGSKTIDNSKLLVASGQTKKSGLGYLRFYEDWNEQDRWWETADKRFTAQEYAAMVSANVDGHCGTMGAGLGLRQADPDARFVMGGLAILGTTFISDMMQWFVQNRADKQWPVDVINMHHYCEKDGLIGSSPEDGGLKARIAEVAAWRDENAPENEFWLTEFGYDMNSQSVNRVPVFAGFTQEQVQAQWLLRSFLILSSTGVDRAAQFMLRNQEPGNAEARFRDCGLTSSHNTGYVPKLSWHAVYTLKNTLGGLYFNQVVTENSDVWAYRYTHPDSSKQVVALWSPTAAGKTYSYRLAVPAGYYGASLISIDGSDLGKRESLAISGGKVLVPVSEMPVFVELTLSPNLYDMNSDLALSVYPNPTADYLHIQLPTYRSGEACSISMYDLSGRLLISEDCAHLSAFSTLDIRMLKPGSYLMLVRYSHQVIHQLIEKN